MLRHTTLQPYPSQTAQIASRIGFLGGLLTWVLFWVCLTYASAIGARVCGALDGPAEQIRESVLQCQTNLFFWINVGLGLLLLVGFGASVFSIAHIKTTTALTKILAVFGILFALGFAVFYYALAAAMGE